MARQVRICVNAGHAEQAERGWLEDPGAVGPTGLTEASVTTRLAHLLIPTLCALSPDIFAYGKRQPGAHGIWHLVQRINGSRPTILLSLHCNASGKAPQAHGPITIYRRPRLVPAIGFAGRSARLARVILERLPDNRSPWSRVVRAPYQVVRNGKQTSWDPAVLRSTRVRSATVLIEVDFISHAPREALMRSHTWLAEMADALTLGVAAYLGIEPNN